MIYSIGSHGAFRCPILADEDFTDCYLAFNQAEDCVNMPLNEKGQFKHDAGSVRLNGHELALNYPMFKNDALAYDALKSDTVSICSRKSSKKISVTAKDFPYWGFWTPNDGGAPFLCIEPWHGHADFEDFTGEFKDRAGSEKLAAGKEADFAYVIKIG